MKNYCNNFILFILQFLLHMDVVMIRRDYGYAFMITGESLETSGEKRNASVVNCNIYNTSIHEQKKAATSTCILMPL